MKVRIRFHKNQSAFRHLLGELDFERDIFFPIYTLHIDRLEVDQFLLRNFNSINQIFKNQFIRKDNQLILIGDLNFFNSFVEEIKTFDAGLASDIKNYLDKFQKSSSFRYEIGNRIFNSENKYVMGILNVTPDSFFDGGKFLSTMELKERIDEFIDSGVDIIDIGGESTRPGSEPIDAEEELKRILPAVEYALSKNLIVSIDTYKSKVAQKCLELGVQIINDISGLKFDPEMADVCANYHATAILMHIRGTPKNMQVNPFYSDTMAEIFDELNESIKIGLSKGIKRIIVDPGIGFGKRLFDNFEILNRIEELKFLGYPILIGASRKSFIGRLLNLEVQDRLTGTIVANAVSLYAGANFIRVHDYSEAIQTKKLIEAILHPQKLL